MSNTKLWDELKRVPPEQLKPFQRAGGFKGTAIRPMWTIHRMTEVFGPCGEKWGIDEPKFTVVPAGEEIMVYCTVGLWTALPISGRIYGVGGDKVVVKQASGLRSDDEAFKKAYTDALTNACKMLGAGADIHMGLWDGNKYVDEKPEPPAKPAPQLLKRDEARALFKSLMDELRQCKTLGEIARWENEAAGDIAKLGDWAVHVAGEISKHIDWVTAKMEAAE